MAETNGPGRGPADRTTQRTPEPEESALVVLYAPLLESFFHEVTAALGKMRKEVKGLAVSMKKNPGEILSMLPAFLKMEQMSLLEIQYVLPGNAKRPGIRFWFEGPATNKRLRAVLFEDTRIWEVSYTLQKLYTELCTFSLGDGEIVAHAAPRLSAKPGADSDWQAFVQAVLRSPMPRDTVKGSTDDV